MYLLDWVDCQHFPLHAYCALAASTSSTTKTKRILTHPSFQSLHSFYPRKQITDVNFLCCWLYHTTLQPLTSLSSTFRSGKLEVLTTPMARWNRACCKHHLPGTCYPASNVRCIPVPLFRFVCYPRYFGVSAIDQHHPLPSHVFSCLQLPAAWIRH